MRTTRLPVVDWTDATRRFKWTRPFRRKTKSGFCARAITFQLDSTWFLRCFKVCDDSHILRAYHVRLILTKNSYIPVASVNIPLETPLQQTRPYATHRRISCHKTVTAKWMQDELNNFSTNPESRNSVLAFVRGGIWGTSHNIFSPTLKTNPTLKCVSIRKYATVCLK